MGVLSRPAVEFSDRWADLLPLPKTGLEKSFSKKDVQHLSRSVRRRVEKAAYQQDMLNETIRALNEMHGFSSPKSGDGFIEESQAAVLEDLAKSIAAMGCPPPNSSPTGALTELCRSSGYLKERSDVAPYEAHRVSLPSDDNQVLDLADLLGSEGAREVEAFCKRQIRSRGEARTRIREAGLRRSYSDPAFKGCSEEYRAFIRRLYRANMVDYVYADDLDNITEYAGIFFVWKKGRERQRMVVEARRSNEHFEPPAHVGLATGATMGRLEASENSSVYCGGLDIRDCFYHIGLPEFLRQYFCLDAVYGRDVGLTGEEASRLVVPRLRVVPMGWPWALLITQVIHTRAAAAAGLEAASRCEDFKPPPLIPGARQVDESPGGSSRLSDHRPHVVHLEYVDNLLVLGHSPEEVADAVRKAKVVLEKLGLPTHELTEAETHAIMLGWEFDGCAQKVRAKNEKRWKIRHAIQEILVAGSATGKEIEAVTAHFTSVALLRRPALAALSAVYRFSRRFYLRRKELWDSVAKELRWMVGLPPLLEHSLGKEFSSQVYCFDASWWGGGVSVGKRPLESVKGAWRWSERWRFKVRDYQEGPKPRAEVGIPSWKNRSIDSAFDVGNIVREEIENDDEGFWREWEKRVDFPELPKEVVEGKWRPLISTPWRHEEPQARLEARAGALTSRAIVRDPRNLGKRILILGDAMGSLLGFEKGRSSAQGERGACRRIAANFLAANVEASWRWLPSEWNSSDGLSRGERMAPGTSLVVSCEQGASSSGDVSFREVVGEAASRVAPKVSHSAAVWGSEVLDEARNARWRAFERIRNPGYAGRSCMEERCDRSGEVAATDTEGIEAQCSRGGIGSPLESGSYEAANRREGYDSTEGSCEVRSGDQRGRLGSDVTRGETGTTEGCPGGLIREQEGFEGRPRLDLLGGSCDQRRYKESIPWYLRAVLPLDRQEQGAVGFGKERRSGSSGVCGGGVLRRQESERRRESAGGDPMEASVAETSGRKVPSPNSEGIEGVEIHPPSVLSKSAPPFYPRSYPGGGGAEGKEKVSGRSVAGARVVSQTGRALRYVDGRSLPASGQGRRRSGLLDDQRQSSRPRPPIQDGSLRFVNFSGPREAQNAVRVSGTSPSARSTGEGHSGVPRRGSEGISSRRGGCGGEAPPSGAVQHQARGTGLFCDP